MKYEEKLQAMLDDPSVHNWVKGRARSLQDHDPVDALHDCELLVELCKAKLEKVHTEESKLLCECAMCIVIGCKSCTTHYILKKIRREVYNGKFTKQQGTNRNNA